MSIDDSSSFSLPEELLIEILVCLPIKTLIRLKSVSKSWLALIDSSEFIHHHTLITTTDNNNNSSSKLGPFIFLSVNLDKNIGIFWNFLSISGNHEFRVYENLGIPPCYSKPISRDSAMDLHMVGSCNGVICLYDDLLRGVSLWNPAIHQFRPLPKSSLTFGKIDLVNGDADFIGFGLDLETKDYKVVLVVTEPRHTHRVQVYSLSTDSWRTLEDVVVPAHPMPHQISNNGGYLNGSYYGLGKRDMIDDITGDLVPWTRVWELFSFDFTKEIFKFWQLPDGMHNNMLIGLHDLGIILLGGKITIIHCDMHMQSYDFFVLNEAGATKEYSWTRLYKIGPCKNFDKKMRPMGISNNGEYVFMITSNAHKLSLLNSSTQVMKELQWNHDDKFRSVIWRAFVYRHSLVPVCSTRNGSSTITDQPRLENNVETNIPDEGIS